MKRTGILLLAFLIMFVLPHITFASTSTMSYYFRSDTITVNGVLGYVANTTLSSIQTTLNNSYTGVAYAVVSYGWLVYRVDSGNRTAELTDGTKTGIVVRGAVGEGYQTGTFTPAPPETGWSYGFDSIKLVLYVRFNDGEWTSIGIFTTRGIEKRTLLAEEWTFVLYTIQTRTDLGGGSYRTDTSFVWGKTGYESQVANVMWTDGDQLDDQTWKLVSGDFIGFVAAPFTYTVKEAFWGAIVFIPLMTIYNKTKNLHAILVLCIILGGSGGILGLLLPAIGSGIMWFVMIAGLAGLLFKVFAK